MLKIQNQKSKRNFSMIEMVVVIVIIAMLAGIATPLYLNHVKNARVNTAQMQIAMLKQAVIMFQIDLKKLPNSLDELLNNQSNSKKWRGPYIAGETIVLDPWDNEYVFKKGTTGSSFEIISYGADGIPGGEEDNADISSGKNK